MSRNFELLTQIECELNGTDSRARAAANLSVVKPVVPSKSREFPSIPNVGRNETLRLVQNIFLSANGSAPRQVVFFGVDGECGSSSVCAGAGQTLVANSSRPVCLIDANVHSPRLSSLLGIETSAPSPGVSGSVREQCAQIGGNLWLAGSHLLADDRGALQPLDKLKHFLLQLRSAFDFLLIDAPGANVCGDAQILGQVAGAAILVVEANSTRKSAALKAKEAIDAAGIRLLGTVLRNRSFPIPEQLYKRL